LQLVMIASMAHDDPEGWHYLKVAEEHRAGDPDIYLLSNLQDVGSLAVNAFQRAADVILQKSIREGFGLTVSEAMWKGRPVVASDVGGIQDQIEDGRTGYLVEPTDLAGFGDRVNRLLADPHGAERIGAAAQTRVRDLFLGPRHLGQYVELLERVLER